MLWHLIRQNANMHIRHWLSWSLLPLHGGTHCHSKAEAQVAGAQVMVQLGNQEDKWYEFPVNWYLSSWRQGMWSWERQTSFPAVLALIFAGGGESGKRWSSVHRAGRALALYGHSAVYSSGQPQPSKTCAEKNSCRERLLRRYRKQKAYLRRGGERILLTGWVAIQMLSKNHTKHET